MPRPGTRPHRPEEFAAYLRTPTPVLLVGGQAVNLWALYFGDATAGLAPFVSADADVLGNKETLRALGHVAKIRPQFFPLKPPSNEVGVITVPGPDGNDLLIEVLRSVHGVSETELRNPAYLFELGESKTQVLVPSPIGLLRAKIANSHDLKQTGRQDLKHVRILARVLPRYLQQLLDTASGEAADQLTERKVMEYAESLLNLLRAPPSKKVFRQLRLSRSDLFEGLTPSPSFTKFDRFMKVRLPRILPFE